MAIIHQTDKRSGITYAYEAEYCKGIKISSNHDLGEG